MRTGLVLGKFMPIHQGHLELIRFARAHCDRLIVLVCANRRESIPGQLRLAWVQKTLADEEGIEVHYAEENLPRTSRSSRVASQRWGDYLSKRFPKMSVIFTSEKYGDYVAEYLNISHIPFDQSRNQVPISATLIRNHPFNYWEYIPTVVRPYFVKKICLYGPESTGKSTLAEQLAKHFHTAFVPEAARDILTTSLECRYEDILTIARIQAEWVQQRLPLANKLLFCDTDLLTTKVYAQYLFHQVPNFEPWIEEANYYHLHLFLETDVPYVQDGTRLGEDSRPVLRTAFLEALQRSGHDYAILRGTWKERFEQAMHIIGEKFELP